MAKWVALTVGMVALLTAVGVFAWVTDAPSYLGHEPSTCNNCHVMDDQYENWAHAAHAQYASCIDCHLPQQNIVSYYAFKGYSGLRDVVTFSLKIYPPAIRATKMTDDIVQANCIRCHGASVDAIIGGPQPFDRYCWSCHRSVAHGQRGLTPAPEQASEVYGR